MTRAERKERIGRMAIRIWHEFADLVSYKNELEELGCMAEAKKLDTILSKLENLHYSLLEKCKTGGK